MRYERMRNLVALVLAAVFFTAVWLGEKLKLAVLRNRVAQVAKRFFRVPDFHYYALADGVSTLFSRLGQGSGREMARIAESETRNCPSSPRRKKKTGELLSPRPVDTRTQGQVGFPHGESK